MVKEGGVLKSCRGGGGVQNIHPPPFPLKNAFWPKMGGGGGEAYIISPWILSFLSHFEFLNYFLNQHSEVADCVSMNPSPLPIAGLFTTPMWIPHPITLLRRVWHTKARQRIQKAYARRGMPQSDDDDDDDDDDDNLDATQENLRCNFLGNFSGLREETLTGDTHPQFGGGGTQSPP